MGYCHQSKRVSPPSHSETSRTQTLMIVPKEQPSELIALGVQSCQRCVQLDPRGRKMALQEKTGPISRPRSWSGDSRMTEAGGMREPCPWNWMPLLRRSIAAVSFSPVIVCIDLSACS